MSANNFVLSKSSEANLSGVHPDLVKVVRRALQLTKIDFGIPKLGGLRSDEEQNALYLDGKSNADGYTNKSKHQAKEDGYSHAVDVYAYVDGKASWSKEHLSMIAAAFLQAAVELDVKVQWGGLWINFIDMPHYQLME